MSLRAQLQARVACCTTKQMQHATFEDSGATGTATEAQQNPANPHEIRVSSATGNATAVQLGQKSSATLPQKETELHVAFATPCNLQLSSLTAERITRQVIEAAMKRCDQFGDNEAARQQMRDDIAQVPVHLHRDLLEHFKDAPPWTPNASH